MATAQALVDEIQAQAGSDLSDAELLVPLDRRHKEMVVRARSLRKTVTVGTTTAGTAFYSTASSGIVEAYYFTVNAIPFGRARHRDVYSYAQGGLVWEGQGTEGLIVVDANASSVTGLTLIPTPDTTGLAIKAYAAVRPASLALGDAVIVGEEYEEALKDGVIAVLAKNLDEDEARADRLEARFDAKCEELRRATRRQLDGSGVVQIRVVGINA